MATGGHAYTGVTGKITVTGAIQGYVEADVTFERDMSDYIEQGSDVSIDHTFGKRKVSGKITKAWGIHFNASDYMYDWFNNEEEKDIVFNPGDGTALYTASGCALKSLAINVSAGDAEPLMLEADFVGLNWSSTDTAP
jgi:hypothetical protein